MVPFLRYWCGLTNNNPDTHWRIFLTSLEGCSLKLCGLKSPHSVQSPTEALCWALKLLNAYDRLLLEVTYGPLKSELAASATVVQNSYCQSQKIRTFSVVFLQCWEQDSCPIVGRVSFPLPPSQLFYFLMLPTNMYAYNSMTRRDSKVPSVAE